MSNILDMLIVVLNMGFKLWVVGPLIWANQWSQFGEA